MCFWGWKAHEAWSVVHTAWFSAGTDTVPPPLSPEDFAIHCSLKQLSNAVIDNANSRDKNTFYYSRMYRTVWKCVNIAISFVLGSVAPCIAVMPLENLLCLVRLITILSGNRLKYSIRKIRQSILKQILKTPLSIQLRNLDGRGIG